MISKKKTDVDASVFFACVIHYLSTSVKAKFGPLPKR